MASVPDIGPKELKRRLDAGETLTVLDVREPWEIELASLPGTLNIPLNEAPPSSCPHAVSHTWLTSPAASTPGRATSIPICRPIRA